MICVARNAEEALEFINLVNVLFGIVVEELLNRRIFAITVGISGEASRMYNIIACRLKNSWYWYTLFLVWLLIISLWLTSTVLASGLGGYISEKLIDRQGVTSSSLLIARQGTNNSNLDIGLAPIATVSSATAVWMDGGTHATLNGSVTTMNGFPTASGYFEWGYNISYGNTTPVQTISAVGNYSADITHYDPARMVYFRFVVWADGTSYSSPSNFNVTSSGSPASVSYNMINGIVPLLWVVFIILSLLVLWGMGLPPALILIIGAVEIYIGLEFLQGIIRVLQSLW